MKVQKLIFFLFTAVFILALVSTTQAALEQTRKTLTVFAAASLTDAFNEIKVDFEKDNAGVEVVYSFGSSATLATQLKEGASADIFASANDSQLNVAREAGRIAGTPLTFAGNRLVLIVPADNPAKIESLKDLAKPDIKLVIAAPKVPVRDYTDAMLEKLGQCSDYGEAYQAAFMNNVVSEEDNVRQVAAKVALGEADAGIVYRSDVTRDIAQKVLFFPIPDSVNTLAAYPIAITNDAPHPDLAKKYIDYVLTAEGQKTLEKWNFIPVLVPPVTATITPEKLEPCLSATVSPTPFR